MGDAIERAEETRREFEEWARLPVLNLNLEQYPPLKNEIRPWPHYRDPTTEIARAAWFAGRNREVEKQPARIAALEAQLVEARRLLEPFASNWNVLRDPLPRCRFTLAADSTHFCAAAKFLKGQG